MSGFSTPQGTAAAAGPKQISSRLLNMKFMQRAAATTAQKDPTTRGNSSSERHPKRRRTNDDFSNTVANLNSPSTPTYSDRSAISGALNAEANSESVKRGTNNFDVDGEETEWVLDVSIPNVNGGSRDYESDDEDDDEGDIWSPNAPSGRQTYGSFKKSKKKAAGAQGTTGSNDTPTSTEKSSKRRYPDDDNNNSDKDLSSIPSNSDLDSDSEGEIREKHPSSANKKQQQYGKFDFGSAADYKRIDSFDFQKAGLEHGLGRQRHGLSGAGGGGRGTGSPARGGGGKHKKKTRKTM